MVLRGCRRTSWLAGPARRRRAQGRVAGAGHVGVGADGGAYVALVESAAGVLAAADLARSAGVIRLAFGHLDYAVDLDIEPTSPAMAHARSTLVVASRAHGLPGPVDGVTTALEDGDDLRTDLAHGRALGMTAKLLIHPKQVDHTHAAFAPTREQIEWAERVAHASGAGSATRLDGHMIDAPVLARALSILERAGGTRRTPRAPAVPTSIIRGMELRELQWFVVLAETEHVTIAAAQLHVSQPLCREPWPGWSGRSVSVCSTAGRID